MAVFFWRYSGYALENKICIMKTKNQFPSTCQCVIGLVLPEGRWCNMGDGPFGVLLEV